MARRDTRLGHLAEELVGTRDDGRLTDRRMGPEGIFEDAKHTHRCLAFTFALHCKAFGSDHSPVSR
jgi:hypothetical protein